MQAKLILALALLLLSQANGACQTPDVTGHLSPERALEEAKKIRAQLQQRITVKALPGQHNLSEAIEYLDDRHHFPVVFLVDETLAEKLVTVPKMKKVTKEAALRQVIGQAGACYELRYGWIVIVPLHEWIQNNLPLSPPFDQLKKLMQP